MWSAPKARPARLASPVTRPQWWALRITKCGAHPRRGRVQHRRVEYSVDQPGLDTADRPRRNVAVQRLARGDRSGERREPPVHTYSHERADPTGDRARHENA